MNVEPILNDLAVLAASPARRLEQVPRRLKAVAALLGSSRELRLVELEVGKPAQGASPELPQLLTAIASAFDGASLRWESRRLSGIAVSGAVEIAALGALRQQVSARPTGEREWPLMSGARFARVAYLDGEAGLSLLGADDRARADNLSLLELANGAIDHLGIDGWELAFTAGTLSALEAEVLDACRRAAARAWRTLGAEPPRGVA